MKYVADGKVVIDVILDDKQVSGGIKKVEGRLNGISGAAKRGIATVGKLAGALGLVGLAYKGIDMVKRSLDGAIDRYDTLNNFPRVMAQIGFDADTSQKAINKLSDGIQGLPTRLDEVASTAQSIAIMTGDLDGAVDTTLALNNAFLASGASTEDAKRGLDQYVQMLSKGEVDLQSWRTLQETMPFALRKTAEAFGFTGKSATNDFYEALKSGEITMSEFNDKLIELDQAQGGFAETAKTSSAGIKTAWTNMKTWVVMGVTDIIAALDEALGGVGSIEGAINSLKPVVQGFFRLVADGIIFVGGFISGLIGKFQELTGSTDGVTTSVMNIISTLTDFFAPAFEAVFSFASSIWAQFVEFFQTHGEMIGQTVHNVMTFIWEIMQFIWPAIEFLVIDTWESIKGVIQGALDVILGIIQFFSALFTGNWTEMWEATKKIFKGALQVVWNLINLWFIGKILKAGKVFAQGFKQVFVSLWNAIKSLFSASVNAVRSVVTAGFNAIRSVITGIMNAIKSVISSILNAIKSVFTGSVSSLKSIVSNGFRAMVNAIKSLMSKALSAVKSIFTNMLDIGKNAGKMFIGIGKDLINGLINGIKNMAGAAIDAITGVVGSVVDKAKSLLKIKSPSRLFMEFGGFISEGMAIGIDEDAKQAVKSISDLTSDLEKEAESDLKLNLLSDLKGFTANAALGKMAPVTQSVQQEIISKQSNASKYDDSKVVRLLQIIAEKDPDLYLGLEKVGSLMDKEQAKRINLQGRRVALE
ncbi:tape measure domain-containing protein [Cerasibacillus quisquiliarum]|uniref:phage tail protein n=1 Tax=Cerasibacillus quisquiliarum TaxID=227865 RepID=UPI001476AF7A|nr:tape measure protein [Cerasibacillus quisquiliarum]MBB5144878.1 tape measure domain-containing protein [Cerasibacillus quisquiliarum]